MLLEAMKKELGDDEEAKNPESIEIYMDEENQPTNGDTVGNPGSTKQPYVLPQDNDAAAAPPKIIGNANIKNFPKIRGLDERENKIVDKNNNFITGGNFNLGSASRLKGITSPFAPTQNREDAAAFVKQDAKEEDDDENCMITGTLGNRNSTSNNLVTETS